MLGRWRRRDCLRRRRVAALAEPELVEGEDYVMDGPYLVLTAAYLLKRGYCCGNGCRNCPWDEQSEESSAREE